MKKKFFNIEFIIYDEIDSLIDKNASSITIAELMFLESLIQAKIHHKRLERGETPNFRPLNVHAIPNY